MQQLPRRRAGAGTSRGHPRGCPPDWVRRVGEPCTRRHPRESLNGEADPHDSACFVPHGALDEEFRCVRHVPNVSAIACVVNPAAALDEPTGNLRSHRLARARLANRATPLRLSAGAPWTIGDLACQGCRHRADRGCVYRGDWRMRSGAGPRRLALERLRTGRNWGEILGGTDRAPVPRLPSASAGRSKVRPWIHRARDSSGAQCSGLDSGPSTSSIAGITRAAISSSVSA